MFVSTWSAKQTTLRHQVAPPTQAVSQPHPLTQERIFTLLSDCQVMDNMQMAFPFCCHASFRSRSDHLPSYRGKRFHREVADLPKDIWMPPGSTQLNLPPNHPWNFVASATHRVVSIRPPKDAPTLLDRGPTSESWWSSASAYRLLVNSFLSVCHVRAQLSTDALMPVCTCGVQRFNCLSTLYFETKILTSSESPQLS